MTAPDPHKAVTVYDPDTCETLRVRTPELRLWALRIGRLERLIDNGHDAQVSGDRTDREYLLSGPQTALCNLVWALKAARAMLEAMKGGDDDGR